MQELKKSDFVNWSIESTIKIALIALIVWISILIVRPFIALILWGIIIAVAVYPVHKKMIHYMSGKPSISVIILSVLMLSLVIVPTTFFIISLVNSIQELAASFESDSFVIPPPPESVLSWPFIGDFVYNTWQMASENLGELFNKYSEQINQLANWLLSSITNIIVTLFVLIGSIIVAGVFLSNADKGHATALKVVTRLVGKQGPEYVKNATGTIRSVVQGVVGVAIIQTALVGAGFFVAGVPGASILTLIALFLAIVQLPMILVVLPVVIYVFSVEPTAYAVIFAIWSILAGLSDNLLKPLMLGRGVGIPMLVILIGAIGGMILFGLIGLFLGSVILSLAYELFTTWLALGEEESA